MTKSKKHVLHNANIKHSKLPQTNNRKLQIYLHTQSLILKQEMGTRHFISIYHQQNDTHTSTRTVNTEIRHDSHVPLTCTVCPQNKKKKH